MTDARSNRTPRTPGPAPGAPQPRARRGARPGVLIAVGTALYFLTLALVLYELDRQHYTGAKAQIIRDQFREIFALPENLEEHARAALESPVEDIRAESLARLRGQMEGVVRGPTSMYSLELRDRDGRRVLMVDDPAKPRRVNTFRNNLFIRQFDRTTDLLIKGSGRIVGHYASPPGFDPIERLTVRFRWAGAGIVAAWMLVYFFLFKYLLRPLQRITVYLERSRLQSPELIPRPRGWLERSYNDIASQALLQQLQERLSALPRAAGADGRRAVLDDAMRFAAATFGVDGLFVAELAAASDGQYMVADVLASAPGDGPPPHDAIASMAARVHAARPAGEPAGHPVFRAEADGSFAFLDQAGGHTLLAWGRVLPGEPGVAFRLECVRQACHGIRAAFLGLRAYQQDMFRQRSEANITLSRNLGHDLTNIIATGKLDLMAVRQILSAPGAGDGGAAASGAHAELLQQSVQGLLETMRFLQEIVNIYRSFSYVKRPAYERHDLNELVGRFLTVFEPTVSKRLVIARDLQPGIPTLILEPRLLKLALFNVLTNALDSFKRLPDPSCDPRIEVATRHDPQTDTFVIRIDDNGPGIKDDSGRPLARAEIDIIFQHGYSTKTEHSEGLGLNWVRTIVEDFHAGRVSAENLPGGGARFNLAIRSMEASEARIRPERI